MIIPRLKVTKVRDRNENRSFLMIQNVSTNATDYAYVMFNENMQEPQQFVNNGIRIAGAGGSIIITASMTNPNFKHAIYTYNAIVGGTDLRILDL